MDCTGNYQIKLGLEMMGMFGITKYTSSVGSRDSAYKMGGPKL